MTTPEQRADIANLAPADVVLEIRSCSEPNSRPAIVLRLGTSHSPDGLVALFYEQVRTLYTRKGQGNAAKMLQLAKEFYGSIYYNIAILPHGSHTIHYPAIHTIMAGKEPTS